MLTPSLVAAQELNDLSMGVEPSPVALGLAAILAGDFATALRMLTPLAKDGNAKAQVYLGIMYDDGDGVAQDQVQAVIWFQEAADQGFATGQSNLGNMYAKGRGVPQDYVEAMMWYRLAAEQGLATACIVWALCMPEAKACLRTIPRRLSGIGLQQIRATQPRNFC